MDESSIAELEAVEQHGQPKMKNKIAVILMAALAITSIQAQPPIQVKCTFSSHAHFPKVSPNQIAWLKQGSDTSATSWSMGPHHGRSVGFVVIGYGAGSFTPSTDWNKLLIQMAQVASEHEANAINYQIAGSQFRVQFLRIEDAILQNAKRSAPPTAVAPTRK
jgi:hypothetical protein